MIRRLPGIRSGAFLEANHDYFYFINLDWIRIAVGRSLFVLLRVGYEYPNIFGLTVARGGKLSRFGKAVTGAQLGPFRSFQRGSLRGFDQRP